MLISSHEGDSRSDFTNGKRRSASSLVPYQGRRSNHILDSFISTIVDAEASMEVRGGSVEASKEVSGGSMKASVKVSVEVRGGSVEVSVEVRGGFMEASMEILGNLHGTP